MFKKLQQSLLRDEYDEINEKLDLIMKILDKRMESKETQTDFVVENELEDLFVFK